MMEWKVPGSEREPAPLFGWSSGGFMWPAAGVQTDMGFRRGGAGGTEQLRPVFAEENVVFQLSADVTSQRIATC